MDPLAEMYAGRSPYEYALSNPVRFIDPTGMGASEGESPPDDIIINNKGVVTNIVKTNKPNRFFDENGNELKFNDASDVDKENANKTYKKGDRIAYMYYTISKEQFLNSIKSVGLNSEIKNKLGESLRELITLNPKRAHIARMKGFGMVALASHGEADFTFSFLLPHVLNNEGYLTDNGVLRASYLENEVYFRFTGDNTIYNLYDAGNFMWGGWTKEVGLFDYEVKGGSESNEFYNGGDTKADQKAIFSGRKYK